MRPFLYLAVVGILAALGCYGQMQPTTCPAGWISWQSFCYFFQNNNSAAISWSEANAECKANQADLLRIETIDEYNFIKQQYALPQNSAPSYWTALNNLPLNTGSTANKVAFMWGNDEAADDTIVKAHWDKEPDNTDIQDCVHISIQATLSFDTCASRHGYVCEIQDTNNVGCINPWTSDGTNMCYFVSNVTSWPDVKTWDDARRTCEGFTPLNDQRKARLLSITTQDTQAYLASFLASTIVTNQVYWTGLNDVKTEGSLVWSDNENSPFNTNLVSWRVEPNNLGGNEHCGALIPGALFSDAGCQASKNYICRMGLQTGNTYNFGCGPWMRAGTKCVQIFSKPTTTWSAARTFCQSQGGDLYTYNGEDDPMWMRSLAPNLFTLDAYFIGLNDQAQEGTFVWPDGSEPSGYLLDWDREPNIDPATAFQKNCAWISYEGYFINGPCNSVKAGTICETDLGPCPTGWISQGQNCYLWDTHWKTHNEARDFCKANSLNGNGQLLAIDNQAEKDFIKAQLQTMEGNGMTGYWTSLISAGISQGWYWQNPSDNSIADLTLIEWSSEPNDWNNKEDCVAVNIHGHLNDVDCNSKMGFVCQKNLIGGAKQTLASWTTVCGLAIFVSWHLSR